MIINRFSTFAVEKINSLTDGSKTLLTGSNPASQYIIPKRNILTKVCGIDFFETLIICLSNKIRSNMLMSIDLTRSAVWPTFNASCYTSAPPLFDTRSGALADPRTPEGPFLPRVFLPFSSPINFDALKSALSSAKSTNVFFIPWNRLSYTYMYLIRDLYIREWIYKTITYLFFEETETDDLCIFFFIA